MSLQNFNVTSMAPADNVCVFATHRTRQPREEPGRLLRGDRGRLFALAWLSPPVLDTVPGCLPSSHSSMVYRADVVLCRLKLVLVVSSSSGSPRMAALHVSRAACTIASNMTFPITLTMKETRETS